MEKLLDAIIELVANSPPDKTEQLADLLARLSIARDRASLAEWAVNPNTKARLTKLVDAWQAKDIPAIELAGMVMGADAAYRHIKAEQEIELVWTGPPSALIPTRKTEQALLQVIDNAQERLFITSFVAYDVSSIMEALQRAVTRGVRVSMLLEASDKHGGGVSIDAIGKMKTNLPAVKVLTWGKKGEGFEGGKVHAKVAVADENICFISSANLTGYAMEKNMEVGILIRGGAIARNLQRHLESLETTNIITKA